MFISFNSDDTPKIEVIFYFENFNKKKFFISWYFFSMFFFFISNLDILYLFILRIHFCI